MPRSFLHKAARQYARRGYAIHPLIPKGKTPLTENGLLDATTDLEQIDEWWTEWPDANIGFHPASVNLGVIDLDGEVGIAAWEFLDIIHNFPETYAVRTPRGGLHLYYKAENFPTTGYAPGRRRCVGEHIDTRGKGGYVLLPPSVTEQGSYTPENDLPIADMPQWLIDKLAPIAMPIRNGKVALDLPSSIDKVRRMLQAYVRRGHVAVEYEGGNIRTFNLACEVRDAGLSSDCAYEALAEHWNEHCHPPWSPEELRKIVENAERYQQNVAGSKATPPLAEAFGLVAQKADIDAKWRWGHEIPQRATEWIWLHRFPARSISLVAGHGDVGKTTLLMDLAARVTRGTAWPDGSSIGRPGKVVYLSNEDSPEETTMPRFSAAGGDLTRMAVLEGIYTEDRSGHRQFNLLEDLSRLATMIKRMGGADLVIMDPISSYFGDADTWKQSSVRAVLGPVADWCREHNIALLGNTHLGKARGGQVNAKILDSVAISAMARSIYMIGKDPEDEGRRLFIPTKANLAPPIGGLSFRFKQSYGKPGVPASKLVWETDPVTTSADEMLSYAEGSRARKSADQLATEACILWLKELLETGPQPANKVMLAASAEGFKQPIVHRARRQLGIAMVNHPNGEPTTMQLPGTTSEW